MTSDVVFFESDASFKYKTKEAIIAIKDNYSGKTYQEVIKTDSSISGEKQALIFAINIAIINNYKHVVFIYDCLALDVEILKKRYEKNFESMQFLWLKRQYISFIDSITKRKESDYLRDIRQLSEKDRDKRLFIELSSYVQTEEEIGIFNKHYSRNYKLKTTNKRYIFLALLYYLLSKSGKKTIKRDFKVYFSREELMKIYRSKKNAEYKGILKQLKINNLFIQELVIFNGLTKKRRKNRRN